jgi:hypothetical protein
MQLSLMRNRCLKQINVQDHADLATHIQSEKNDRSFLGALNSFEMTQNVYTLEEAIQVDSESRFYLL